MWLINMYNTVNNNVKNVNSINAQSQSSSGFDPNILRYSGIWGAADEAVLNNVHKRKNPKKSPFKNNMNLKSLNRKYSSLKG